MNINIYADERIADAGPPHTRARVLRPSARARARAIGRPRIRADACERLPAGVDRGWLGAQAFRSAAAFNANIGAWNTARVTTLSYVCAALSGPGGAPPQAGRARRGRRCGAGRRARRDGRCARACAQTCGRAHARVPTCVRIAARSRDGLYACVYMYVYICIYM